ncbi:MAG: M64 family metallopeptidase, partial [Rhodothermales bacterium]|nr:M64 family metallopeptidase [Rhodothermales bacterium]
MRHALLVLLILTGAGPALGQRLLPLVENGPAADRLNVVVVAEGYTGAQEAAFQDDAGAFLDDLFQAPPYDAYAPYFNAYGLFAASAESGADHPARNLFRDTYFDAYYDCAGIARLICLGGGGHSRLNTLLADLMPEYDLVLVLVNDPEYGGSGGQFAISSTHPSASEIAIHELGHSFAGLRDTYESGGLPPAEGPNATAETRRTHIRWTHWIDASTPLPTPEIQAFAGDAGLFEGAVYTPTGWYRPRLECKMRSLGQPFCEVCTEYHIAAIYDRLSPVEDYAPAAPALVVEEGAVELRVTPRAPALHALAVQWYVDGAAVAGATGTVFTVEAASLPAGPVTVEARVTDPTPLVRDALLLPLLEDRVVWEVRRGAPVPAAPVLAAPEDGVPAGGVEPTFAWQAVPGAEAYHLQVAADSTFALAWYRLARAAGWTGDRQLNLRATDRAQGHAADLPERA